MTPTSDYRREVAARLRKTHGIMAFVEALGIDPDGDWCWTDVSRRVADLIEPEPEKTCHIKPDEKASEECCGPMLSCDACGTWIPPINGPYRYCPYCGARVVSGDGE